MKRAIWFVTALYLLGAVVLPASAQGVKGDGTAGQIPVWLDARQLGNSVITQTGGQLGVGTQKPQAILDVFGANTQEFTIRGINTSTVGQGSGGYFQTDSESGLA